MIKIFTLSLPFVLRVKLFILTNFKQQIVVIVDILITFVNVDDNLGKSG